jgi:hypothetical protein
MSIQNFQPASKIGEAAVRLGGVTKTGNGPTPKGAC